MIRKSGSFLLPSPLVTQASLVVFKSFHETIHTFTQAAAAMQCSCNAIQTMQSPFAIHTHSTAAALAHKHSHSVNHCKRLILSLSLSLTDCDWGDRRTRCADRMLDVKRWVVSLFSCFCCCMGLCWLPSFHSFPSLSFNKGAHTAAGTTTTATQITCLSLSQSPPVVSCRSS